MLILFGSRCFFGSQEKHPFSLCTWTAEIVKCDKNENKCNTGSPEYKSIKTPPFKDDELDKLKEYLIPRIEKLMKLWPTSENEIDLKDWKIVYK